MYYYKLTLIGNNVYDILFKVTCRFSMKHRSNIEFKFDPLMPIVFDSFTGRSWKRAQPDFDDPNTSLAVQKTIDSCSIRLRVSRNAHTWRRIITNEWTFWPGATWHEAGPKKGISLTQFLGRTLRDRERAHSEIIWEGKLFVPRWTVQLFYCSPPINTSLKLVQVNAQRFFLKTWRSFLALTPEKYLRYA